ncbi:hypothetical protein JOF53_008247 [Crossiella equi]|uniref:Uncharacterized protein n=1 Tax=Crossiella equi TaxID=130796 RepID=A0ABS5AS34_9PSEU|nr:hypothetical protein [Crossiella equi]
MTGRSRLPLGWRLAEIDEHTRWLAAPHPGD